MKQNISNENDLQEKVVNGADRGLDTVDMLVADFLQELAAINPDKGDLHKLEAIERKPIEKSSAAETILSPSRSAQEDTPSPPLRSRTIHKQIEESLNELERLTSKVVPITDRKESKPEPAPPIKNPVNAQGPVQAPNPAAAPARRPASSRLGEMSAIDGQEWNRLELFRNQVISQKPFPWLKVILGILILVLILGVPIYQMLK